VTINLPQPDAAPNVAPNATLPISETFTSIQGEGALTGVPSFFIRVSGCNLRCTWCDTPYASWNPDGAPRSIDSIVSEARASGVRHVVLTGGEPMIFPQVHPLCDRLRAIGMHITIETAGTIAPPRDLLPACDLMSISPKLANSTPSSSDPRDPSGGGVGGGWAKRHEARRLNPAALQALLDAYPAPARQLKFVVPPAPSSASADLAEIDALLSLLRGVTPADVMLMPEGVTVPPPDQIAWIVEACLQRGWRYCARLHLHLFGNTRGT
jgi:7-carboxy-7-deazaguanine synthase